jgi:hypothetical protein
MHRIVAGILVRVLGMSVVAVEDEGQDKQPATPEQQYKALLQEYRIGVLSKEEQEIRSATDMLLRDHVASAKLGRVVEMLGSSQDKKSTTVLRAICDENPSKEVKAEACVALALQMQARVAIVKQFMDNPQFAKSVEQNYGKDYALELQKADLMAGRSTSRTFTFGYSLPSRTLGS